MVIRKSSDTALCAVYGGQQRSRRSGLSSLAAASLLLVSATATALSGVVPAALAQSSPAATKAASMTASQATAAAETILNVVQSRDAQARFDLLSDDLKAVSSPALLAKTIARQPKILSWRITSIDVGLDSSTVDALLQTGRGSVPVVLVINNLGKLAAYQVDESKEPSTRVAQDFITAVVRGKFGEARSFLSLSMQKEISPQALQAKWLNLQSETGNFVRTRRIIEAERSPDTRLVLVNLEFTRMADTLFVILDGRNQIVGLDFPNEPALIKPNP